MYYMMSELNRQIFEFGKNALECFWKVAECSESTWQRDLQKKKKNMFHCFSVKWILSSVVCAIDFACEVDGIVCLVSVWK